MASEYIKNKKCSISAVSFEIILKNEIEQTKVKRNRKKPTTKDPLNIEGENINLNQDYNEEEKDQYILTLEAEKTKLQKQVANLTSENKELKKRVEELESAIKVMKSVA